MRLWVSRAQYGVRTKSEFVLLWASKPVRDGYERSEYVEWVQNKKCKCKMRCVAIPIKTFKALAGCLPSASSPMLVDVRITPVVVVKKPSKPQAKKA